MRSMRHARAATAATAALCAVVLVSTTTGAEAARKPDPTKQSKQFRKSVSVRGINQHLDALQAVADANGGNRASGTPGYTASRNYVVSKLREAGYRPTVQTFEFPYFNEDSPAVLARVSPSPKTFANPADFITMTFSGSGDVTAPVAAVDTDLTPSDTSTSGCEAADFAGFPVGAIALVQRGTCSFGVKAANAEAAGAGAVVIANRGTTDNTEALNGTLGTPVDLPVVGTSYAAGKELLVPGTTARVRTATTNETRTTYNVIAETKRGKSSNVVMSGAHLDSVEAGPGINDNGSGSAAQLEIAEQMAKVKKPVNKVRFAWWGAEELGLLGATHYVDDLSASNPDALQDIALYLNFDMLGSPNFVRFVYDGDNSTGEGTDGPDGSAAIEKVFTKYFKSQRLPTKETAFDGRSDYGPFIAAGVPAGGLFSGAEDVKTAGEAKIFGGTAGAAYDSCYHQACDDRDNISATALDQLSDGAAHAIYTLSRSTQVVNGQQTGHRAVSKLALRRAPSPEQVGHQAVR